MTRCESVGLSGGCGFDGPVFQDGECKVADEFFVVGWEDGFTEEQVKYIREEGLYLLERKGQ